MVHITTRSTLVALDTNKNMLFVSMLDLQHRVANFTLAVKISILDIWNVLSDILFYRIAPEAVVWVSRDAVSLLYFEPMVLIGPQDDVAVLQLDKACANCTVFLHTEVDVLHIVPVADVRLLGMFAKVLL